MPCVPHHWSKVTSDCPSMNVSRLHREAPGSRAGRRSSLLLPLGPQTCGSCQLEHSRMDTTPICTGCPHHTGASTVSRLLCHRSRGVARDILGQVSGQHGESPVLAAVLVCTHCHPPHCASLKWALSAASLKPACRLHSGSHLAVPAGEAGCALSSPLTVGLSILQGLACAACRACRAPGCFLCGRDTRCRKSAFTLEGTPRHTPNSWMPTNLALEEGS